MRWIAWTATLGACGLLAAQGADFRASPQRFLQELTLRFEGTNDPHAAPVQLIEAGTSKNVRVFVGGKWYSFIENKWTIDDNLSTPQEEEFVFAGDSGERIQINIPWRQVCQILRFGSTNYIRTTNQAFVVVGSSAESLGWITENRLNQLAISPEGLVYTASSAGLYFHTEGGWKHVEAYDEAGRLWTAKEVLGVAFDSKGRLWFASKAGVGCKDGETWRFFEGKDGVPWNDFTCLAADLYGGVWFGTHLGAIHYDGENWNYRQGPLWLPNDDVCQVVVSTSGTAWFGTKKGVGAIEKRPMSLAEKAEFYEQEIERYIKRTSFGFVAEAHLRHPTDKSAADPQDSDNDGLWTAMYGAGECFAYAATKDLQAKQRAKQAFEALRFLQKVTEGGLNSPPKGYIARTVRPIDWPDPNVGRIGSDLEEQKHDRLWKVYEPRWPKSADGKWYWKSDTSSDELDGHYFFYPLYYDFCAESDEERERVRDVVRGVTDHLLTHSYLLIDHDGKPTRWGVYGPQFLNRDPDWWPERGLNSLSMLSYLAVAQHITGDSKYAAASRDLIDQFGYAHNAMHPKVQHGPGSGNQSDDEMAFMCFYSLLRYSTDERLKEMIRYSFFRYWINEAPELNPFFNFAYAASNLEASGSSPWGKPSLKPWSGWLEDAMATLYGFPLDRLNWAHQNSHRLDVVTLPRVRSSDLDEPVARARRGHRVNGKVIPVENRHFNHWNTDPWEFDYGGNGGELAAGTVFLLPYYMGVYHGFIERPEP